MPCLSSMNLSFSVPFYFPFSLSLSPEWWWYVADLKSDPIRGPMSIEPVSVSPYGRAVLETSSLVRRKQQQLIYCLIYSKTQVFMFRTCYKKCFLSLFLSPLQPKKYLFLSGTYLLERILILEEYHFDIDSTSLKRLVTCCFVSPQTNITSSLLFLSLHPLSSFLIFLSPSSFLRQGVPSIISIFTMHHPSRNSSSDHQYTFMNVSSFIYIHQSSPSCLSSFALFIIMVTYSFTERERERKTDPLMIIMLVLLKKSFAWFWTHFFVGRRLGVSHEARHKNMVVCLMMSCGTK